MHNGLGRFMLTLVALLSILTGASAARSAPSVHVSQETSRDLVANDPKEGEPTIVVMPPDVNQSCPNGRVFFQHGLNAVRDRGSIVHMANDVAGSFVVDDQSSELAEDYTITTRAGSTDPSFDCTTLGHKVMLHDALVKNATDSHLTRINSHDLLAVYLVGRKHAPKHPAPPFDGTSTIAACSNAFLTESILVAKSVDCGDHWTRVAVFDVNDAGEWAQPSLVRVPEYVNGVSQQGSIPLDEPFVYADSLSPKLATQGVTPVYITSRITAGPSNGKYMLFHSGDGGSSWNNQFMDGGNSDTDRWLALTATHDSRGVGHIYTFNCEDPDGTGDFAPTLRRYSHGANPQQLGVTAFPFVGTNGCAVAASNFFAGSTPQPADSPAYIVQVGAPDADAVAILYPSVDSVTGLQIAAVGVIAFPEDPNLAPFFVDQSVIAERAAGRSITYAAMRGADHFEYTPAADTAWFDPYAIWWLSIPEPVNDPGPSSIRAGAIIGQLTSGGTVAYSRRFVISRASGAFDSWKWQLGTDPFVADYFAGAFYVGGRFHNDPNIHPRFVLPFVQSHDDVTLGGNSNVHVSLVTLKE